VTAADGVVVGSTQLVDHGPDAARWTLVLLAEGYQQAELPKFAADAETFIDRLFNTRPYAEMWCAINIWRVDIASTDTGADDPAACGDGTVGAGTTAATFFDATYCTAATRRLLAGNQALALATANAQVAGTDAVVVIINAAQYGGAGGGVAWFSTHPDAADIGIHELGHSAFALIDEYGDIINNWAGGEPAQANATANTNRATTKWATRIRAGTPLPTMSNPDCTTEDNRASPVDVGTVGLFENAGRAHCGLYRSEHDCKMRHLAAGFCGVCQEAIRRTLRPHLPAAAPAARRGVQFVGTVPPNASHRWFTHDWPACWHVIWTVEPTSLIASGPGITWHVRVERATREMLTYWIEVNNPTGTPVDVEARYEITATT
jgi:IgA Peptidase M64